MFHQTTSRSRALRASPLALLALLFCGSIGDAQIVGHESSILVAADEQNNSHFGCSIAVDGDVALFGSKIFEGATGRVHVFRGGGSAWSEEFVLEATDREQYELFGVSVAVEGEVAVVGAEQIYATKGLPGKAYVFRDHSGTWVQEEILLASDGIDLDRFGHAVAVENNRIIVGADHKPWGGFARVGAVYIFEFDGSSWNEVQKLLPTANVSDIFFGTSLAAEGDTLMVGANGYVGSGAGGAVFVYEHDGSSYVQQQIVEPATEINLGLSVSLSGDLALAGRRTYPVSALTFDGSSWIESQLLSPPDPGIDDRYGTSLALSDSLAIIGSHRHTVDGQNKCGAGYIYRHDGVQWVPVWKGLQQSLGYDDQLAGAVAVSEDCVLAGAERYDGLGDPLINSGAVYTFCPPAMAFQFQPNEVDLGDALSIVSSGGSANAHAATFITAVNGVPFSQRLFVGSFDTEGVWQIDVNIPNDPALSGLNTTMMTFALMADGSIEASNEDTLSIL